MSATVSAMAQPSRSGSESMMTEVSRFGNPERAHLISCRGARPKRPCFSRAHSRAQRALKRAITTLRRPHLARIVRVHDAEARGIAFRPLVVVEQGPGKIATDVDPGTLRCAHGEQVVRIEFDTPSVIALRDAVL